MHYLIKPHARKRLAERSIPERIVHEALEHPTKIGYDERGKLLIKKVYRTREKYRLLLIAGEMVGHVFEIITVIDTSKIKKYL